MPRRLLDALPRLRLRRSRRRPHCLLADLRTDVHDDELPHRVRALGREVHPVAPAHGQPDEHERRQVQLVNDARDVAERGDRAVDVRRVAIAVAALVERPDVEVRLERDGERVPRVGVPREAVEQQEMRAALAAPVENAQLETVDGDVALVRPQEIHEA
jgi:hypothetical protein